MTAGGDTPRREVGREREVRRVAAGVVVALQRRRGGVDGDVQSEREEEEEEEEEEEVVSRDELHKIKINKNCLASTSLVHSPFSFLGWSLKNGVMS